MADELALHAYVLLGNVLHHARSGAFPAAAALEPAPEQLAQLHAAVEPLTPANIVPAIAALPPEQRALLGRVCAWFLHHLDEAAFDTQIGLPKPEASAVLEALNLPSPPPASAAQDNLPVPPVA